MSDADCEAAFKKADTNSNGVVSDTEASQYFAAMRIANKPAADGKLTKTDFISNCKSGMFDTATRVNDPGAPLAGANSFTEAQAQDRALAAGYSKVSALKKDDKGVWRGTANGDGKDVNVAVDFKGNVVVN
jgi:hypothetical protein